MDKCNFSLTDDRTTKTQPPPTCQHDAIQLPAAADNEEQKEVVAGRTNIPSDESLEQGQTGHGSSISQLNSPISLIWLQWETAWLAALLLLLRRLTV